MLAETLLALCLVGDSYTFGVVSGPPELSYAERLETLLSMPIENVAKSGTTTSAWLPGGDLYRERESNLACQGR